MTMTTQLPRTEPSTWLSALTNRVSPGAHRHADPNARGSWLAPAGRHRA